MLRPIDIQKAFSGAIGWKQSYDTSDIRLADFLTKSETGLYYQQAHPLLTLSNLKSIAPDFSNMEFQSFEQNKEYSAGEIVKAETVLYKSLKDNNKEPLTNSGNWEKVDLFSDWLREKTDSSIYKVISRFVNEKIASRTLKLLCESKTLFDGTGRLTDTVDNKNNVVGFEIVPVRSSGVTTRINRLGLQLDKPCSLDIYIFHSSSAEPIYKLNVVVEKPKSMTWIKLDDVNLPYKSEGIDSGGSWYLCYKQSELGQAKAIKKNKDWSQQPCKECSRYDYTAWKAWSKYIEIHPFYVNEELVTSGGGLSLLDAPDDYQYVYDTNFGINLDISVECDSTESVISQKSLFYDLILKQVAVDMLREFAYNANVRTNRHSINASRAEILYELDGDTSSMRKSGLSYELELAMNAVSISLEGIDRVCLPCNNHGVKYRVV